MRQEVRSSPSSRGASERSEVRWGTRTIAYQIRRSARRKTVAVSVDAEHGVLLTAPQGVPVARLDAVVRDRARWIVTKLRLVDEQARERSGRAFVSGESVLYLGRHYRLKVRPRVRPREPAARLQAGWMLVEIARELEPDARGPAVRQALERWYLDHARAHLDERVQLWAGRIGVEPGGVLVPGQAPGKRWASCDRKGVLRFSWRVIQAPMRLVDYVVAHELVHLVHADHSDAFWSRLELAMPDYARRREELRRLGGELEW